MAMHVGAAFTHFMMAAAPDGELELEPDIADRQLWSNSSRQDLVLLLLLLLLLLLPLELDVAAQARHLAMMLSTACVQSSLPLHEAKTRNARQHDTLHRKRSMEESVAGARVRVKCAKNLRAPGEADGSLPRLRAENPPSGQVATSPSKETTSRGPDSLTVRPKPTRAC